MAASVPKLTPTERRLYTRLVSGPASPMELLTLLYDEMASVANLHCHLSNMRRKGVRVATGYSGVYCLLQSLDCTPEVDQTST